MRIVFREALTALGEQEILNGFKGTLAGYDPGNHIYMLRVHKPLFEEFLEEVRATRGVLHAEEVT